VIGYGNEKIAQLCVGMVAAPATTPKAEPAQKAASVVDPDNIRNAETP
jgi:hypothetical protein